MLGDTANVTPWEECQPQSRTTLLPRGDIGHVAFHAGHHLYNVIKMHHRHTKCEQIFMLTPRSLQDISSHHHGSWLSGSFKY